MTPDLDPARLPRAVVEVCSRLKQKGHNAWLVGGCVRDSILAQWRGTSKPGHWVAKDWDIATDATPQRVMEIFRKVIPTGVEHGTVTVLHSGIPLEVTTLRVDAEYRDGRRPDSIEFVQSIEEDLARRDFTVNAIAFEPNECQWVAPHGGLSDLRNQCLRAVGDPARRFGEDGLRVLRAARFVATLEFELETDTLAAIRPSLESYRQVSAERIRDEWNKALSARQPSRAFVIMRDHGLLEITAPELGTSLKAAQPGQLPPTLQALNATPNKREVRLATLCSQLHPNCRDSAQAADRLMQHLRYSNAERKWVVRLVEHQELPVDLTPGPDLRRWLRKAGPDLVKDLLSVHRAQQRARSTLPPGGADPCQLFEASIGAELATKPALRTGDLALNGKTLMSRAGLKPGRHIGILLEQLLELVLDDPKKNSEELLLKEALKLNASGLPERQ